MKIQLFLLVLLSLLIFSCSEDNRSNEEEIFDIKPQFEMVSQLDLPGRVNDIWGFEKNGIEYVLICSFSSSTEAGQVNIININDPSNPEIESTIESRGFDMKVWGDYLYVVNGSNAYGPKGNIYNISDPKNPVFVSEMSDYHNIFIDDEGYLYVTGYFDINVEGSNGSDVSIFNLNENPINLKEISSVPYWDEFEIPAHDISVIDDRLYIFSISMSYFKIVDVSDKLNPVTLGIYEFDNNENVHSGWVTTNHDYVYICLEQAREEEEDIVILDISNPNNIERVGLIHDTEDIVHNTYIIDDLAYTSFYNGGFRIYQLEDPTNPELIYEYNTDPEKNGYGAFGVYPFFKSGIIGVSDGYNGLFLFREVQQDE